MLYPTLSTGPPYFVIILWYILLNKCPVINKPVRKRMSLKNPQATCCISIPALHPYSTKGNAYTSMASPVRTLGEMFSPEQQKSAQLPSCGQPVETVHSEASGVALRRALALWSHSARVPFHLGAHGSRRGYSGRIFRFPKDSSFRAKVCIGMPAESPAMCVASQTRLLLSLGKRKARFPWPTPSGVEIPRLSQTRQISRQFPLFLGR